MSNSKVTHLWHLYQIKVSLEGMKPPVWRRLIVDSRIPLDALHQVIQITMGWGNAHLHQFVDAQRNIYGESSEEYDLDSFEQQKEENFMLQDLLHKVNDIIWYDYDFGDDWRHKITLEKVFDADIKKTPVRCIKGMRICPAEDSGGVWSYMNMLEILKDPGHEQYEDIKEWLGEEFDPQQKFDVAEVQKKLDSVFGKVKFFSIKKSLNSTSDMSRLTPQQLAEQMWNDPKVPQELKELFRSLIESMDIIDEMSDVIEECYHTFYDISRLTKSKKIRAITDDMLNKLENL